VYSLFVLSLVVLILVSLLVREEFALGRAKA
jgi:hypothetical protein